ncbi:MAG: hypothetical protein WAW75_10825, partial [Gallionella sp.]
RWAYQVLEQEEKRKVAYKAPDGYRHLRNSVSHPKLSDEGAKVHFQAKIGADCPDVRNGVHLQFIHVETGNLLQEAERLVEGRLTDHVFWKA